MRLNNGVEGEGLEEIDLPAGLLIDVKRKPFDGLDVAVDRLRIEN